MNRNSVWLADIALIGVTFVWGTTFIVVQNALNDLSPLAFNAWRFLIATAALAVWSFLPKKRLQRTDQSLLQLIRIGFFLGFFLFIGYICQTIGLLYTTTSNAAFITGLSVVLVPVFSSLFLKRLPRLNVIIGVFSATAGLFLLTTKGSFSLNRGDWIVFVCAIAFTLQIVFTEKYTRRFNSLHLTLVQLGTVALLAFLFGGIAEPGKMAEARILFQPNVAIVLLFMGLIATAAAFLLQTVLQKRTSATHVGLIYIMEPVFAAWTAFVFQKVSLGAAELSGCLLILVGMFLAEFPADFFRIRKQRNRV